MTDFLHIDSWKKFAKHIRPKNSRLLCQLEQFPDAILVGGCQRSGTTMLSEIIMQSNKVVDLTAVDKELNAALILSGNTPPPTNDGRYCFQTTYLNENYEEYWKYGSDQKLIWIIRKPLSVIYSLTRFSEKFCLDELFLSCGYALMEDNYQQRFNAFGLWAISRIRRACYSYNAKAAQAMAIMDQLGGERMLVIDYDELVNDKTTVLATVFDFIGLPFQDEYGDLIHKKSLKKSNKLSEQQQILVNSLCMPSYQRVRELIARG